MLALYAHTLHTPRSLSGAPYHILLLRCNMDKIETAQQRFDRMYITSAEICKVMGVNRTTVLAAKKRGMLPDPILVNDQLVCLWEREAVKPYIDAWKLLFATRRSGNREAALA